MAYFDCIVGGSGKGNTLVVTCADDLAGATITCTNGTKTYTKTCPSTAPYEVTFYGLEAGTWTVSAAVSGNTYTTTVVVVDCAALLGGFNWRTWVDTAQFLDSTDYNSLEEVLADEEAVRELCLEHACVDYMADIATANEDVETIINNDLFAKWVNNSDYSLDVLGANVAIKALMDTADKYFYGEWTLQPQVPTMTSNTAPSGEVIYKNLRHGTPNEAYKIFVPSNATSITNYTETQDPTSYIGYDFGKSVRVSGIYFKQNYVNEFGIKSFTIKGSNDKSTWESIVTITRSENAQVYRTEFVNDKSFRYYAFFANTVDSTKQYYGLLELQFYAWQPKGNVPVMTSNTAPYGEASASTVLSGSAAYLAFDGQNSTAWNASSTAYPQNIDYKFTNPVCAKRFHMKIREDNIRVQTYKIQASNDGFVNDIHDLTDTLTATYGANGDWVDMNNNDYYLYYRLLCLTGTYTMMLEELQFYGRELSVSVPKMATNTTPYGEAVPQSDAYKAFDNSDSSYPSIDTSNGATGYIFTSKVKIKAIVSVENMAPSSANNHHYLEYSDDGVNWTRLETDYVRTKAALASEMFEVVDKVGGHKGWRWICGTVGDFGSPRTLQFYGLDYSEKEFEEGATKKWLYDHGVELETLTVYENGSTTVAERQPDCILLSSTSDNNTAAGVYAPSMDLTAYSLMRCKVGKEAILFNSRIAELVVTSIANANNNTGSAAVATVNANYLPNNPGLDISLVNQSLYPYILQANGGSAIKGTFVEWWLE